MGKNSRLRNHPVIHLPASSHFDKMRLLRAIDSRSPVSLACLQCRHAGFDEDQVDVYSIPVLEKTTPVLTERTPVLDAGSPGFIEKTPVLENETPVLGKTAPVLESTTSGMNYITPVRK
jgi:hypothetical protein